jgi:glycosyltransferase involved in cell wall biosynthesis
VPEGEIVAAYEELAARPGGGRRRPVVRARTSGDSDEQPLVSAVIPYHGLARHVGETVASLFEQTYPRIEVTIVNDGSFEEEDWLLAQLSAEYPLRVVTTRNSGLGAARNMGVLASAGSYLLPLDADNALAPEFTARCLELLEARPELAYATTWLLYVDEDGNSGTGPDMGWQPLSNDSPLNAETNVAGDAVALIRRRVFERGFAYSEELTSYEDWHLYRELHRAGLAGAVIPERLVRYRVRPDSMTGQIAVRNRDRLVAEIDTLMREREIQWTS